MNRLLALVLFAPLGLAAQTPLNTPRNAPPEALARADALVARGDSTGALKLLQNAAAKAPNDAELWHAYGKLASDMTRSEWRKGFIRSQRAISLIIAAESSLARASRLAPDSARYLFDYGKHLWGTNITSNSTADRAQRNAVKAAMRTGDSTVAALSADEIGIMLWRRYENQLLRLPAWVEYGPSYLEAADAVADNGLMPSSNVAIVDFIVSTFHYAAESAPDNERALRHELMVYAAVERWPDLSAAALQRTRQQPQQPWGWFGFALAEHRLGHRTKASAAFDKALSLVSPSERARLTDIKRLLPPDRNAQYAKLNPEDRSAFDAAFWKISSPSWLLPGDLLRSEFLARVVYSELMYTSDEQNTHGLDSDRGSALVRFGPPDIKVRPTSESEMWLYQRTRNRINFLTPLWRGTGYYARATEDSLRESGRTDWFSVPLLRNGLDTISTTVARFRGPSDSIDLAVLSSIRTGRLARGLPSDSSRISTALFTVNPDGSERGRIQQTLNVQVRDTSDEHSLVWRQRIAPKGSAMRVEALEPDMLRAARTLFDVQPIEHTSYGLSDVLVAQRVRPRTETSQRWTDFDITPSPSGTFSRSKPVDILWETYELAGDKEQNRYRISVRVERLEGTGLKAFAARIVSGLGNALRNVPDGANQVTVSYDRQVHVAPAVADYLSLDLSQVPPGRCTITIIVLDLVSGRTELGSRNIVLMK